MGFYIAVPYDDSAPTPDASDGEIKDLDPNFVAGHLRKDVVRRYAAAGNLCFTLQGLAWCEDISTLFIGSPPREAADTHPTPKRYLPHLEDLTAWGVVVKRTALGPLRSVFLRTRTSTAPSSMGAPSPSFAWSHPRLTFLESKRSMGGWNGWSVIGIVRYIQRKPTYAIGSIRLK